MNRHCDNCGQDVRLVDEIVVCGHDGTTFCSSACARARCGECHDEHQADLL